MGHLWEHIYRSPVERSATAADTALVAQFLQMLGLHAGRLCSIPPVAATEKQFWPTRKLAISRFAKAEVASPPARAVRA